MEMRFAGDFPLLIRYDGILARYTITSGTYNIDIYFDTSTSLIHFFNFYFFPRYLLLLLLLLLPAFAFLSSALLATLFAFLSGWRPRQLECEDWWR